MLEDEIEKTENRTIKDALKYINPNFYDWIKEIS